MPTLEEELQELLISQQGKGLTASMVEQESGPTVESKSLLKKMIPTKEEIPELIGSMAGSFMRRTPAGIGLSALGAGAGEAVNQFRQHFKQSEERPKTSTESLKKIFFAGLRGAGGESFGRGTGKIFHPFSGGVSSEIEKGVEAATRRGIDLPLSVKTESAFPKVVERMGEISPFGSEITRKNIETMSSLKSFADRIGDVIAPEKPYELQSSAIKNQLTVFDNLYKTTRDKLYKSVPKSGMNKVPELKNTLNAINEAIEKRGTAGEPEGLKFIRKLSDEIYDKTKTVSDLIKAQDNIGIKASTTFGDPTTAGVQSELKKIYAAMSSDINSSLSGYPNTFTKLKEADQYFSGGMKKLESKVYDQLKNAGTGNEYKVVMSPVNPENVKLAKSILGDDVTMDLGRQWWDDTIKQSLDPNGTINPRTVISKINTYEKSIKELFKGNAELLSMFDDLKTISQALLKNKNITGGSQTAYIQQSIMPILSGISGLITGLSSGMSGAKSAAVAALGLGAGLGSQWGAKKMATTAIGQKYLTKGFPRIGKTVKSVVEPAFELGLQRLTKGD